MEAFKKDLSLPLPLALALSLSLSLFTECADTNHCLGA